MKYLEPAVALHIPATHMYNFMKTTIYISTLQLERLTFLKRTQHRSISCKSRPELCHYATPFKAEIWDCAFLRGFAGFCAFFAHMFVSHIVQKNALKSDISLQGCGYRQHNCKHGTGNLEGSILLGSFKLRNLLLLLPEQKV